MIKFRKSQVNIEFIGGFMLFLIVIVYVAFSLINAIPMRQDVYDDDIMRLQAWKSSEIFLKIAELDGRIEDSRITGFAACAGYNYNDPISREAYYNVTSLLNVSESNYIHLVVEEFPIALLDSGDSAQRSGFLNIKGTQYQTDARNTSAIFNETQINGIGAWLAVNDVADFGGTEYRVAMIGTAGDFVIFKRAIINCGPHE